MLDVTGNLNHICCVRKEFNEQILWIKKNDVFVVYSFIRVNTVVIEARDVLNFSGILCKCRSERFCCVFWSSQTDVGKLGQHACVVQEDAPVSDTEFHEIILTGRNTIILLEAVMLVQTAPPTLSCVDKMCTMCWRRIYGIKSVIPVGFFFFVLHFNTDCKSHRVQLL